MSFQDEILEVTRREAFHIREIPLEILRKPVNDLSAPPSLLLAFEKELLVAFRDEDFA